jgi:hypothetical protein
MRIRTAIQRRTTFVSLAVAVLAFAGCGGSGKTVTSTALPAGVNLHPAPLPTPVNATFTVPLTGGFKRGSPNGTGLAVVSINASTNELCWTISQLKNITAPTEVRLFRNFPGASGENGFYLGGPKKYKPSGCIHLLPVQLGLMTSKPQVFYVSIHDRRFPGGAIRGPL